MRHRCALVARVMMRQSLMARRHRALGKESNADLLGTAEFCNSLVRSGPAMSSDRLRPL
jgi:hypothetical protein